MIIKGGEILDKKIIALIVIVIVVIVGVGIWYSMQATPAIKTVNNSSNTAINTNSNTQKNTTNTTNSTNITAAKAKALAGNYVGMGVELETPTLTTYKGVKVWKVPVYTNSPNKVYLDPIYINAKTGQRVT
jgi:cytoskeletal protein RodZ